MRVMALLLEIRTPLRWVVNVSLKIANVVKRYLEIDTTICRPRGKPGTTALRFRDGPGDVQTHELDTWASSDGFYRPW